ncbi:hypothetical protein NL676_033560 [Syzygium grande]|nr:hypothetical protein NL676_033560 [Syzygium grande]
MSLGHFFGFSLVVASSGGVVLGLGERSAAAGEALELDGRGDGRRLKQRSGSRSVAASEGTTDGRRLGRRFGRVTAEASDRDRGREVSDPALGRGGWPDGAPRSAGAGPVAGTRHKCGRGEAQVGSAAGNRAGCVGLTG